MASFLYTGDRTLIYFKYLDLDAQRTLVANPGEVYDIFAVEGDSVPPGDGRWASVPAAPAVAKKSAPPPPVVPDASSSDDKKASE